jgi:hypothetical protein
MTLKYNITCHIYYGKREDLSLNLNPQADMTQSVVGSQLFSHVIQHLRRDLCGSRYVVCLTVICICRSLAIHNILHEPPTPKIR